MDGLIVLRALLSFFPLTGPTALLFFQFICCTTLVDGGDDPNASQPIIFSGNSTDRPSIDIDEQPGQTTNEDRKKDPLPISEETPVEDPILKKKPRSGQQIFCIHDWGNRAEQVFAGKKGWVVTTLATEQTNPDSIDSHAFDHILDLGHKVILRIDVNYSGTSIPGDRTGCENYRNTVVKAVQAYTRIDDFVIGNETNAGNEGRITVEQYADCFNLVASAMAGARPGVRALIAAIGQWNPYSPPSTGPSDLPDGNYLYNIARLTAETAGGYAIHANGNRDNLFPDPRQEERMRATQPWQVRMSFAYFKEQIELIDQGAPGNKAKPVYITETNPFVNMEANPNFASPLASYAYPAGWLRNALLTIDEWNKANNCRIKSLCWFRYGDFGFETMQLPRIETAWNDLHDTAAELDLFSDDCR